MRRSFRTTTVALAAASLLALLEIFRTTLTRVLEGTPVSLDDLLHRVIPMWITIVIASPWCAFMAWRFPFRGGRTLRTLFAHSAGAAIFVALQLGLLLGSHFVVGHLHRPEGAVIIFPSGPRLLHTYFFYIAMEMSVYASIVMVLLLLETRRHAAEREIAAARLEQSVASARLESLQAQIHPHFLFNTLNALAVLARKGDGAAVDRAIGDLGELLRGSFEAPARHETALGDDLAFVERYLALQRIRFPDRLEVEWDVEVEARHARVPVMMVQPLVENALEHGLATVRGGHVRVSARRDPDPLVIEVADDGPGFAEGADGPADPEVAVHGASPGPGGRGVGLANTRERLRLLYGDRGRLECGNREGGGGVVRIRLPWRADAAAENRS